MTDRKNQHRYKMKSESKITEQRFYSSINNKHYILSLHQPCIYIFVSFLVLTNDIPNIAAYKL